MRYLNSFLLFGAVACLLGTYIMERKVVDAQQALYTKRQAINENRHTLHLLQAEWALLTSPEHLSKITEDNNLAPVAGKQLMTSERLHRNAPLEFQEARDIPLSDILHDR